MGDEKRTRLNTFLARWAEAIASVMGTISASPWKLETLELPCQSAASQAVSAQFQLAGPLTGSLHLALEQPDAFRLVALFVGEESKEWTAEQQEGFDELSRQFAGEFATRIKNDFGEVAIQLRPSENTPSAALACITFVVPGSAPLRVWITPDPALEKALSDSTQAPQASDESVSHNNLDLLMHVPLEVTLRFGQREMLLQEILDLQSGSVVELDRSIEEPVDLLLNDRIIARGSVVVVDGNYGLRVSEVGPVMRQA